MAGQGHTFDFSFLDDLLLLTPEVVPSALVSVRPLHTRSIGPLVEYAIHRTIVRGRYPSMRDLVASPLAEEVDRAMKKQGLFDLISTSLEPLSYEFSPLPNGSDTAPLLWRAFKHRLANAAHAAGFAKPTSKGLAGAFGELEDNARGHSQKPQTVLVGYRWCPGEFEMVVADAGIGVLQSLRSHPDYRDVADHGTALQTALSSGETRFGRGSGHGTGFDTVFRSMAGMQGSLRFRSGNQSLELNGLSPTLINSKLKQRSYFQGFAVSIICRPA